jgi:hypothetical protein
MHLLLVLSVCADYPDLQIGGIADEPDSVMPGDMYCCVEHITRSSVWNGHDTDIVEAVLEAGAVAILAEAGTEFPDGLIPDTVPVVYADEVDELAARLAAVLHGEQVMGGRYNGQTLPVQEGSTNV